MTLEEKLEKLRKARFASKRKERIRDKSAKKK